MAHCRKGSGRPEHIDGTGSVIYGPQLVIVEADVTTFLFALQKIGDNFITELSELRQLEKFVKDKGFLTLLGKVKQVRILCFCCVCVRFEYVLIKTL